MLSIELLIATNAKYLFTNVYKCFIWFIFGFTWFIWLDRVRNEEVHRRAGIERELAIRADQRVLRWYEHVERMDEYCMARRVLMAEVSGGLVWGRPRFGWVDGVKVALGNRNDGWGCESMRKRSERVESPGTYVTEWVSCCHFWLALCSFGPPSHALVVITWRGVGCRYMVRLE